VRDVVVTGDGAEDLAAKDRLRLTETHEAVLRRLEFDTGTARADYRQEPGRPPELLGIRIVS
jgi:hypothetical protein